MINPIISISIFLLAGVTGEAMAANCSASTGYIRVAGDGDILKNELSGKTACKANVDDWEWQEYHDPSGALIDWKNGPSDPVDPSAQVGTWSATNGVDATVTYTYGAQSNSYAVWKTKSGLYDFCIGTTVKVRAVSLLSGQDSC
jgi:hypothetical protein